ncbi:MAG: hypothetical protein ACR2LL_13855 [Nitrosopumilus sp.]|uniref:hypothetical protein n=1 Tax=Nitrosopumilus sp. TaxID=2024843 RepID=UPI00292E344F|nr:hypothetical protein [Nitrosopumilus sp.]
MLSKRTIIGLIVGSIIIGIGIVSLVQHIGTITVNESYVVAVGDSTLYVIPAPIDTQQSMKITGDSFDVKLESPADGLHLPETSYKDEKVLEWVHLDDGESKIHVQNTGSKELVITGTLIRSSDPIWFTYDLMVIISGVVIIGFSMGFTLRKPKGF